MVDPGLEELAQNAWRSNHPMPRLAPSSSPGQHARVTEDGPGEEPRQRPLVMLSPEWMPIGAPDRFPDSVEYDETQKLPHEQ